LTATPRDLSVRPIPEDRLKSLEDPAQFMVDLLKDKIDKRDNVRAFLFCQFRAMFSNPPTKTNPKNSQPPLSYGTGIMLDVQITQSGTV